MLVLGKSGVSVEQLEDRKRKGAKYIELFLLENDINTEEKIQEIIKRVENVGLEVRAVHIPEVETFYLEGLLTEHGLSVIENTCKLAQNISSRIDKTIAVVMHLDLRLDNYKSLGAFKPIAAKMNYLLNTYPGIEINLENVTVFDIHSEVFVPRSNYRFENAEVCEALRKELNTDRIGTVLDTCHAMSSIEIVQYLGELGITETFDLHDYFVRNKDVLKVIHLANMRDFGRGVGHGCGFDTDGEFKSLMKMMEFAKEIDYKGIITLEVSERNHNDAIVLEKLLGQIKEIAKELKLNIVI